MTRLHDGEFHLTDNALRLVAEHEASGRWVRPLAAEVLDLRAQVAAIRALADRWSQATIRGILSDEEQPDLVARGFAAQLNAVLGEPDDRA